MPTVYLAGAIAGRTLAEMSEWRGLATEKLWQRTIAVRDPMRGRLHRVDGSVAAGSMDVLGDTLTVPLTILARDRNDVSVCDLMLVHLDDGPASTGTLIEIGWASAWSKPIVLYCDERNLFLQHPFVLLMAAIVHDLDVAVDVAASFLGRGR